jgi:hypothetical protein
MVTFTELDSSELDTRSSATLGARQLNTADSAGVAVLSTAELLRELEALRKQTAALDTEDAVSDDDEAQQLEKGGEASRLLWRAHRRSLHKLLGSLLSRGAGPWTTRASRVTWILLHRRR